MAQTWGHLGTNVTNQLASHGLIIVRVFRIYMRGIRKGKVNLLQLDATSTDDGHEINPLSYCLLTALKILQVKDSFWIMSRICKRHMNPSVKSPFK